MSATTAATCKICQNTSGVEGKNLSTCAKCKSPTYCSRECQTKDWPAHRRYCGGPWWDSHRVRKCDDGSLHEGKLELVTWTTPRKPDDEENDWDMGWGATVEEEADEFKQEFEVGMQGDELKLYKSSPQAFRWTCCGLDASNRMGCDHHGTGSKPCTCNFCKMGQPLTEKIYKNRLRTQYAQGLELSRGPDPRSYNVRSAGMNAAMRGLLGMDH